MSNRYATTAEPPRIADGDPSSVGRSVNRYEILCEIGSGGMAIVYLGRASGAAGFERLVAIKRCHPHLRQDAHFLGMFLDEARLAAQVRHPNVVATFDVVHDEDSLCLVMEYVEGDAFQKLLRGVGVRGVGLPPPVAMRVVVDTLAGLEAAHSLCDEAGRPLNIVHRDVSPQNILLGVDGVARLADFGIAKAEARATTTGEGMVKGKLAYMAPEQIEGHAASRGSDVYAAGVVLWESLAGRRLFHGENDIATVDLVLRGVVPRPSQLNAEVTAALEAVVLKALATSPSARFGSAVEFAEALDACDLRPASARRVATFATAAFAGAVALRREAVRRAFEARAAGAEPRAVADPPAVPGAPPAATPSAAVRAIPTPGRRGRVLALALGACALAVFAAVQGPRLARSSADARSVERAGHDGARASAPRAEDQRAIVPAAPDAASSRLDAVPAPAAAGHAGVAALAGSTVVAAPARPAARHALRRTPAPRPAAREHERPVFREL